MAKSNRGWWEKFRNGTVTALDPFFLQIHKCHVFFVFSNALKPWNMYECPYRNSICKKWHSVQGYRGEIQLSGPMVSVCVATESNQREYKAGLSLMATHRLPEDQPCHRILVWKSSCELNVRTYEELLHPPVIFTPWRLQHVQGQNPSLIRALLWVCTCFKHKHLCLLVEWNYNYSMFKGTVHL